MLALVLGRANAHLRKAEAAVGRGRLGRRKGVGKAGVLAEPRPRGAETGALAGFGPLVDGGRSRGERFSRSKAGFAAEGAEQSRGCGRRGLGRGTG